MEMQREKRLLVYLDFFILISIGFCSLLFSFFKIFPPVLEATSNKGIATSNKGMATCSVGMVVRCPKALDWYLDRQGSLSEGGKHVRGPGA